MCHSRGQPLDAALVSNAEQQQGAVLQPQRLDPLVATIDLARPSSAKAWTELKCKIRIEPS